MAGLYPDVPGRRMAYDADGSVAGVRPHDTPASDFGAGTKASQNSEQTSNILTVSAPQGNPVWLYFIFPELREIDGYFATHNTGSANALQASGDTTNGVDGTWTTPIANVAEESDTFDRYRSGITSLAESSIRGLRASYTRGGANESFRQTHIYGTITPGQTPDRLLFIDEATGLEFTASVDYGDVPRGGSEDLEWRIKNNSASLQANTIQYTATDLYRGSAGWYTHTLPGGSTYQSTRQVASLAAATTSGLIKTRRITPGDAGLGKHAARTHLNVDSWT